MMRHGSLTKNVVRCCPHNDMDGQSVSNDIFTSEIFFFFIEEFTLAHLSLRIYDGYLLYRNQEMFGSIIADNSYLMKMCL